ncbi:DUF397 domain-containing protein [Streptomyces sp. NPDC047046]|uniref:DUF397 domain-containing protein n=1 Tax=Streptomyces sp. NPDC047046 TaxID=3155378 RepID=UPI0033D28736
MTIDDTSTLAVAWTKSSYSADAAQCVEYARVAGHVAVRDSKQATGPAFLIAPATLSRFAAAVSEGSLGS